MKIVVKEVGKDPVTMEIEGTLEEMHDIVGGYIEVVSLPKQIKMAVNEDGKLIGLKPNIIMPGDVIVGNIFFVGVKGEDFVGLTEEQEKYVKEFLFTKRN